MTINYLDQFQPGQPIDVEVLNKLIQNVNFLASQIAQIYKLPAPQAPNPTNTGGSGNTGGNTDGDSNPIDVTPNVTNLSINLSFTARFNNQTLQQKTVEKAMIEKALSGKTISDFEIVGVSVKSLMFIPASAKNSDTKAAATGAQLSGLKVSKNIISFTPKPISGSYKSGVNAPSSTATNMYGRLYINLGLDLKVKY